MRNILGVLGLWGFVLSAQLSWAAPAVSLLEAAGFEPVSPPHAAAAFALPDTSGKTRHLREQRGKVVFLNFWATWCPPCVREMPEIEQLFTSLRRRSFTVLAVAMHEAQEQVAAFVNAKHLTFPVLLDLDGAVSSGYGVKGLPTTYLIDCAGNIVGEALGPRHWTTDAVRTLLAALLNNAACR